MDALEKLTPDHRVLIASLPYRAGLWVSAYDKAGGGEAHAREMVALENILHGFSEQVFGSELLQYVMNETINHKELWPTWAENLAQFPKECEEALDVLRDIAEPKDVKTYAMRLIEIGEAVALAFREEESTGFAAWMRLMMAYITGRLRAGKSGLPVKSYQQYLNISLSEREALRTMAGALGVPYSL